MEHNCTRAAGCLWSAWLSGTVLPPKNYEHKNISHLPFLRGGQRSVQSNDPSPSKPTLCLCLLSQHWDEIPVGSVLLVMGHAEDGSTTPSWLSSGENPNLGEATAEKQDPAENTWKKGVSSNILCSERLLSPCSKCVCFFLLTRHKKEKSPEELWANVKKKYFLRILCIKKQYFCTC